MSEFEKIQDTLNLEESDLQKLPSGLNVLTILTYIGSGLGLLGGIYNYFTVCSTVEKMEAMGDNSAMSGAIGKMVEEAMKSAQKQCDNRTAIAIITVVTCILCFVGAMQMRNRKKSGFLIYSVGELLGPLAMIFFIGSGMFAGFQLIGVIIPILMVILYATQRKHLIN
ncbi:MAG: hypothetical protein JNM95_06345 [Chitinophagaceae bacterium]|nr:hypothetical protein [Chitinophagaceae bacterium]